MTTINKDRKLGVYIHIPFCLKKCAYCDFLSFEGESEQVQAAYVKALINEMEFHGDIYGNNYTVNSIFIGGGTPSILAPDMIHEIIRAIKLNFNIDADTEITIEANPKTMTGKKFECYLGAGINRLSIGAQSFDGRMLNILGRAHTASDIKMNFTTAREAGFKNINLDLIFGIPGQSFDIWKETLYAAINAAPEHISFYSLQVEEGTKLYEMLNTGRYEKISDELDREMYHYAIGELSNAGYNHYEISNAAKGGYECRHNIKYWSMDDYLGAGLGAHSYIGGVRFGNLRGLEEYIGFFQEGLQKKPGYEKSHEFYHENSAFDDMAEYMFTGLRMMRGVSLECFEVRFEKPLKDAYSKEWPAIEKYIRDGFLILDGGWLRLSEKGIDVSNRIMSEFV